MGDNQDEGISAQQITSIGQNAETGDGYGNGHLAEDGFEEDSPTRCGKGLGYGYSNENGGSYSSRRPMGRGGID